LQSDSRTKLTETETERMQLVCQRSLPAVTGLP
jgi:hypothetical protein